mgnify:CR=1 FL=1
MTDTATRAGMEHIVPFDPYSYEFHEDPYPTYARLRADLQYGVDTFDTFYLDGRFPVVE